MEKYNEMREDGSLFSWAESVELRSRQYRPIWRSRTAEAVKSWGLKKVLKGLEKRSRKRKKNNVKSTAYP